MVSRQSFNNRHYQHGAAALLVSVLLLVSATLVVFYASRSTILEQKISANDVRAKQAMAAAQAGSDHLFANVVSANGVTSCTSGCTTTTPTYSYNHVTTGTALSLSNASSYQATFCDAGTYSTTIQQFFPLHYPLARDRWINMTCAATASGSQCKCPGTGATRFVIRACGWSDDQAARQSVSLLVDTAPVLASPPTNPLIALGQVERYG